MSLRSLLTGGLLIMTTPMAVLADAALVMVEETGCIWCARWNEEIGSIYPKTKEGRAAPLMRIDIHAARPSDMSFSRSLNFTPTFVLVVDGQEQSRIEGYPGEDFFWGLLQKMLSDAQIDVEG